MTWSPAPLGRPQGAFRIGPQNVRWRVWAPRCTAVSLVALPEGRRVETAMAPEGDGYFVGEQPVPAEGLRYGYRLAGGQVLPDPASRWQPDGVHQASAVFFPDAFPWTDQAWRGVPRSELVIYELHVGTFTPEGTFAAIIPRLAELRALGITALELMPVAQFPGTRNWGYDGVHPYAAQNSYGGPRGLQQLVDAAHAAGLAVLLDVVYNHLGNEGNYLGQFGPYFTERYHTPWGPAVNYDGPDSDPVRQFVVDNAGYWVRDFHLDGLRLDAVQTIYDLSPRHILAEIQEAVQREAEAAQRTIHVIAETNQNDVRLIDPPERGGYGLDGLWSDDFHHSVHALLTGEREGYYQDFGTPAQLAKAFDSVFVYDGCHSVFRRRRHGTRVGDRDRGHFVVCIQNHDQVGNRACGDRFGTLLSPAAQRLACGLLLVSPCTPLLFMGEEYGETRPFPFFCSFLDPQLVKAVRRGRRAEHAKQAFHEGQKVPDPQAIRTFAAAQLSWSWPAGSPQAGLRALYHDLLAARRTWSALRDRQHTAARVLAVRDAAGDEAAVLLVERGADAGLLACANLTPQPVPLPAEVGCRDALLSTEEPAYGGQRRLDGRLGELAAYELVLFGPAQLTAT